MLVLVGVPGSGKTTVGRQLAEQLSVGFRDTDVDVETLTGRTVAEIFISDGEDSFRELERTAVAAAIGDHRGVLALGGGAVLDSNTRRLLAEVPTAWLQVTAESSSARVGLGVSRPVLLGNVRGQLIKLMRERAPLYEEVADVCVDTDARTPAEVADEIISALNLAPTGGANQ